MTQDWPDVEGLLKQRQDLIVTIDQMDARIQDLRSRQPLDQEWLHDGQKKKILSLLNNIRDLSEKAQTVDKECMDRMTDWQGQIKSQLSRMRDSLKSGSWLRPETDASAEVSGRETVIERDGLPSPPPTPSTYWLY